MNHNLRRLWIISFINCAILFTGTPTNANSGAPISLLSPQPQCIFDPSGYFYARERLPKDFEDFAYIRLWRKEDNDTDNLNQGLYATAGKFYRFTASKLSSSFEFHTTEVNKVSYSFTGRLNYLCIFEEFDALNKKSSEIAAEGKLSKFIDGAKVAETTIQLVYSAKPQTLKNDVNALYPSGRTDLFYAVRKGDLKSIRAMLARGAKVNIRDREGQTALVFAIDTVPERALVLTIARMLIAAGADVNLKANDEAVPLQLAVYEFEDKRGELVRLLLAAGADANAKDNYGTTVLMHAIHGATQEATLINNVRQLIRAGAQVNIRNKLGQTALSIALENNNDDLIKLLKQAGAKP
jgi:ankyrin repeat protein